MSTLQAKYLNLDSFDAKKLDVFIQLGKDLNEDVLSEMMQTYFQTTDETIKAFDDFFEKKDYPAIARLCHKLKSSAGQIGLLKLNQMCTDLENLIHNNTNSLDSVMVFEFVTAIQDESNLTYALLNNFLKAKAA